MMLGVGVALVVITGQAAAEGLPPTSRIRGPQPIGPSWTGFYLGLGVGAGALSHDLSVAECPSYSYCGQSWYGAASEAATFDGSGEGVFGVLTIGYDQVIRPGWVAGVFADYDFGSSISSNVNLGEGEASLDHNFSWSVGGRLGYLASAGTLLYGTAGYTRAEFDVTGLPSQTFDGFFVGAGVETFMNQSWTLKFEYRYSQFSEQNIVDDCPVIVDFEPSMHSARVVLSYKLGRTD
jgi:outer membrane immunogenic protein